MAGITKKLVFAEGVNVSAPAQTNIQATSIGVYASDAAFVSAKGSPATEGDEYGNSTIDAPRYYNGSIWTTLDNVKNNFSATISPTVTDDSTQNYSIGSKWINVTLGRTFTAIDVSTGAAVWLESGTPMVGTSEIPTGLINGSNKIFTVSDTPIQGTIVVLRNGLKVPYSQYTFVHPTLTMTTAPAIGQVIEVFYLTDGTTATRQLDAGNEIVEYRTISAGEFAAKQLTLTNAPVVPQHADVDVYGGVTQFFGIDYSISGTTFTWNGYALDGTILIDTILRIAYYKA